MLSFFIIFIISTSSGLASFMPQDSILLANLVSTTASQLAELTELLNAQKKVTQQFTTVSNAINEKVDLAEQIQYHAEEIIALKELDVTDLESLVDEVKRLKGTIQDTKEFVRSLEREKIRNNAVTTNNRKDRRRNANKKGLAVRRAAIPSTSSQKDISLANAKTNAITLSEQINTNNNLLDIKEQLIASNNKQIKKDALLLAKNRKWENFYGMEGYTKELADYIAVNPKKTNIPFRKGGR
ncbi:MAG: hypothetical protein ISR65_02885 [Bacteriovoracaceae bacterium]|nr:hypothetical protein [Bacteriovoracaceae bacterium]